MASMDWGGAISGGVGGASMGSMLGPVGSVVGGIGGALGGLFGGKKGKGPTFMEYNPDKAYRDSMLPLWNQNVAYDQDVMRNLQQGMLNPGMETALQQMLEERKRQLYRTYYGDPGDRGSNLYNQALETASITGVGPKAAMAQAGKLRNDYSAQQSSIYDYINQLKFQGLQNLQNQYGAGGAATPYKSQTQTPYMMRISDGTPASNPIASALGSLGGMALGSEGGMSDLKNSLSQGIGTIGSWFGGGYSKPGVYGNVVSTPYA